MKLKYYSFSYSLFKDFHGGLVKLDPKEMDVKVGEEVLQKQNQLKKFLI